MLSEVVVAPDCAHIRKDLVLLYSTILTPGIWTVRLVLRMLGLADLEV